MLIRGRGARPRLLPTDEGRSTPGKSTSRTGTRPGQPQSREQTTQNNPRFHSNTRHGPDAINIRPAQRPYACISTASLGPEQVGQVSRITLGGPEASPCEPGPDG